jgi:hypothetical protein
VLAIPFGIDGSSILMVREVVSDPGEVGESWQNAACAVPLLPNERLGTARCHVRDAEFMHHSSED